MPAIEKLLMIEVAELGETILLVPGFPANATHVPVPVAAIETLPVEKQGVERSVPALAVRTVTNTVSVVVHDLESVALNT